MKKAIGMNGKKFPAFSGQDDRLEAASVSQNESNDSATSRGPVMGGKRDGMSAAELREYIYSLGGFEAARALLKGSQLSERAKRQETDPRAKQDIVRLLSKQSAAEHLSGPKDRQ